MKQKKIVIMDDGKTSQFDSDFSPLQTIALLDIWKTRLSSKVFESKITITETIAKAEQP